MRAHDNLWKETDRLLKHRPGWTLQEALSPGAPPAWCFGSGSAVELSVTTGKGAIDVYVVDMDEKVTLSNTGELIAWLKTHKTEAMQEPRGEALQGLKPRKFFRWD